MKCCIVIKVTAIAVTRADAQGAFGANTGAGFYELFTGANTGVKHGEALNGDLSA